MKKRLFVVLIALALVLTFGSLSALADDNGAFEMQDFGLWGESWPDAWNVGWKFVAGFDVDTITALEVGIKDASDTAIVTYTADLETIGIDAEYNPEGLTQLAWQKANDYFAAGGQSSAPFYKEYNNTPIAEGDGADWTVVKGAAFEAWTPASCYVKVYTADACYIGTNNLAAAKAYSTQVFVAEIGGTKYATLADAFAAAGTTETIITLLKDVTLTSSIFIKDGKNVTLDLNNHTISKASLPFKVQNATFHVTGTGTIQETANNEFSPIVIYGSEDAEDSDYSNVIIDSGVVLRGWAGLFIDFTGTTKMAYGVNIAFDGEIIVPAQDTHITPGIGIYINGSIKGTGDNCPKITIGENARITANDAVIYAGGYADWTVNGGTFSGNEGFEIKAGTITVNGGSFTATNTPSHTTNNNGTSATGYALVVIDNPGYGNPVTAVINDGTFNGPVVLLDDDTDSDNNVGTLTINGGTFSVEPAAEYIAAGKYAIPVGDMFIVDELSADTAVAEISGKYYLTLATAVEDAAPGVTVKLLKDVNIAAGAVNNIIIDKAITIDGGGNTISRNYLNSGEDYEAIFVILSEGVKIDNVVMESLSAASREDSVIYVDANGTEADPIVISNNTFDGKGFSGLTGILTPGAKAAYLKIENNTFVQLKYAAFFNGVSNGVVSGNTVSETQYNAFNVYDGAGSAVFSDNALTNVVNGDAANTYGDAINCGIYVGAGNEVVIESGSISVFDSENDKAVYAATDVLTISGGSYSVEPAAEYIAEGKVVYQSGSMYVVGDPYVASPTFVDSGEPVTTVFDVIIAGSEGGKVVAAPIGAKRGGKITLTVIPEQGYALDTLTAADSAGKEVVITETEGVYSLIMPSSDVTVKAAFKQVAPAVEIAFDDVPEDTYYTEAVYWAVANGITNGTTETTFSPEDSCTRAQAVTFLWRAAGKPKAIAAVNPFTDIEEGAYYYEAVLWAVEQGITNGTSATTFSPEKTVSRAEFITFLYRYAAPGAVASELDFNDVAADAFYAEAVKWAAENGITGGTGDNNFSPDALCLRGQTVTFLWRLMGE